MPSVATRVSWLKAPNASDDATGVSDRPRAAQASPQLVEVAAEQHPVDGAEEEGGVRLVDQHRQATVHRAAW